MTRDEMIKAYDEMVSIFGISGPQDPEKFEYFMKCKMSYIDFVSNELKISGNNQMLNLEQLNWIREHKGQIKVQLIKGVWSMIVSFEQNEKKEQFITPVSNEAWFEELKSKFDFK